MDPDQIWLFNAVFFYQVLNEKQHNMAARNEYNFDHPDAFDFELLHQTLLRLKDMRKVEVPIYNFVTHRQAELFEHDDNNRGRFYYGWQQCCGSGSVLRNLLDPCSEYGSGSTHVLYI